MIVDVDLGKRSYPIIIERGLLEQIGPRLKEFSVGSQVLIVTDDIVAPLYAEQVLTSLQTAGFDTLCYTIAAGEASKSWEMAGQILSALLSHQFHRDCTVLALGGGVVGDLAGFVASVYQRGVHFVQVPTSLLAQVDSSVGGKVAVNHALGKNMIGAFYQPLAVWIDLACLETLEMRQWYNGLAEVIKYGVIADAEFFAFLEQHQTAILNQDDQIVAQVIARCCQLKAAVVAQDEMEKGLRAKLNFGHTIGHGLESADHFSGYLHGEAVAIGMVLATHFAVETGFCSSSDEKRLKKLLQGLKLPITIKQPLTVESILSGMALDKKIVDGKWVFILPREIGQVDIVAGIDRKAIKNLLERQVPKHD